MVVTLHQFHSNVPRWFDKFYRIGLMDGPVVKKNRPSLPYPLHFSVNNEQVTISQT